MYGPYMISKYIHTCAHTDMAQDMERTYILYVQKLLTYAQARRAVLCVLAVGLQRL